MDERTDNDWKRTESRTATGFPFHGLDGFALPLSAWRSAWQLAGIEDSVCVLAHTNHAKSFILMFHSRFLGFSKK